jgi:cytochrome d ubiquinol oxidase subunit I
VIDDFWAMVFNPSSVERLTHVILGCWMAGAFLVVSISAFYLLRGRHLEFAKSSMRVGLAFAAVSTILQVGFSGSQTAEGVVKNQPIKLAAMEGVFETRPYTPMTLFGWVDEETQEVSGPKVPGLLSFLVYKNFKTPVVGLNDLPTDDFLQKRYPDASPEDLAKVRPDYWPKVNFTFQVYHIMIIVGTALLGLVVVALFFWWRGWLFRTDLIWTRWLLMALVLSVLGPQIANQAGWFTAEIGRQPWIVYEILKTSDSLSKAVRAEEILASLIMFAIVYTLLFALFIYTLTRKIQHGPDTEESSEEMPESWKSVIRKPSLTN